MKKDLSNYLKASLEKEKKTVEAREFNGIEKRFAKAETFFEDNLIKDQESKEIKKEKVIRDTFSIPQIDYRLLNECKHRGLVLRYPVNKSEIVRAGLILLNGLPENDFINALKLVKKVKTGRSKYKS